MSGNRITEIRVQGLRSLADVRLKLDGLTVLIGHNGSGKSSLIEACEILRRAAGENFIDDLQKIHGGVTALMRLGQNLLEFTVGMAINGRSAEYTIKLSTDGRIYWEEFCYAFPNIPGQPGLVDSVFRRQQDSLFIPPNEVNSVGREEAIDPRVTALSKFRHYQPHPTIRDAIELLRGIDVHLPFDTTARWAQRARGIQSSVRGTAIIEPAAALTRFGNNLANAFHDLKNNFSNAHWEETMNFVRLGLGFDIESVNTQADPGGGSIALRVKYAGIDEQLPAFALSDGTLSYLCFVAMARLNTQKSIVVFDEPDTHLHPELLMRVLDLFEAMAEKQPILLATHSDRLLDGLSNPADSVVVCELDEKRATQLRHLDKTALADWLTDYRGIGDIRSAGHMASVLAQSEES